MGSGCAEERSAVLHEGDAVGGRALDTSGSASTTDSGVSPVLPDATAHDVCRRQCYGGACVEAPLESFEDREATYERFSTRCTQGPRPSVLEARCADGSWRVDSSTGYAVDRRYFDAAGRFRGLVSGRDKIDDCESVYWPEKIVCERPEVTRVACGEGDKVGDVLRY